jgi:hypothetical protein
MAEYKQAEVAKAAGALADINCFDSVTLVPSQIGTRQPGDFVEFSTGGELGLLLHDQVEQPALTPKAAVLVRGVAWVKAPSTIKPYTQVFVNANGKIAASGTAVGAVYLDGNNDLPVLGETSLQWARVLVGVGVRKEAA